MKKTLENILTKHFNTYTGEQQSYNLNGIEVVFFNSIYNKTFMSLTKSNNPNTFEHQKPIMVNITNLKLEIIIKKITLIVAEQKLLLKNTQETLDILYEIIK